MFKSITYMVLSRLEIFCCLFKNKLQKQLVLLFILLPIFSLAQNKEEEKNKIIEKRIEYLIEDAEESDADYSTIFDQLSYYTIKLD